MKVKAIVKGAKSGTKRVMFVLRKKAPDILIALGITAGVAGTVSACVATTKAVPKYKGMKEIVKELKESDPSMSPETKKEIRATKLGTAADIAKDYAGSAALSLVSVSSVLASHHIVKQRNVALAAAYTALDQGFRSYRENVINAMGEEADQKFRLGEGDVSMVNADTGEVVEAHDVIVDPNLTSDYACYFDQRSPNYDRDHEMNMMFLRAQQRFATNKLIADRSLFLNDVNDMLGLPRTKKGQVVGWVYKEGNTHGDNFVDLRIRVTRKCDEYGHIEPVIVLDPNCDGPILNDFEE